MTDRIDAWRLVPASFAESILSGEGGLHVSGRFSSGGRRLVHAADHLALAAFERLVHLTSIFDLRRHVYIHITFPDTAVRSPELPSSWDAPPPYQKTVQAVGDNWLMSKESVVLRVPSAVIPNGFNFLLNPEHPDWKDVIRREQDVQQFPLDERLISYEQ